MSQQYNEYLYEHRNNVEKGYRWLREHIPSIFKGFDDMELSAMEHNIIFAHDSSKDSKEEYDAYDKYFYGGNRSFRVVNAFNYAWLHHIHNNTHHWQHWVLINDDPNEGEKILDMPYEYVIEMICDWWAFSWKSCDLSGVFKWYGEHKAYMKLSMNTRYMVDGILSLIEARLEEGKKDENM